MRIAFFEDQSVSQFGPIALLRPVFELVCGHFSQRERMIRGLPVTAWGGLIRDCLAASYSEEFPEAAVNDPRWLEQGPTLLVNGRWLAAPEALADLQPDVAGLIDGTVAYLTVEPAEAPLFYGEPWETAIHQIARLRQKVPAAGKLLSMPWDLVEQNRAQIETDFAARSFTARFVPESPQIGIAGPSESIAIDRAARIEPFVMLDASAGPISIEAGALVQSFSRLEGPCHIGAGARLFRANVRGGTTIGPGCRVGGEIEASILHGFVNKYHDGFVGHSYLCPWVNLGALSTNSDLKNDYSTVRVPIGGPSVDTGLVKVGCFIGDHTKTGLGSLFNTGSSIGVMCMILPGGELLPRHVPSFTAVWHGELADAMPLERSLAGARAALARRDRELTAAQDRLLRHVYQQTRFERNEAITRFHETRRRQASSSGRTSA